jgi:hypothetical protein
MITVHVCRGERDVCSAGVIEKNTTYPKTRIDAAHDVIAVSGRPRSYFVSVFHDSNFIATQYWHIKLPDIRNLCCSGTGAGVGVSWERNAAFEVER